MLGVDVDKNSITTEANGHLNGWRNLSYPPQIAPSNVWADHIAANLVPLQSLPADQLIDRVTGTNATSEPTTNDSPIFRKVLAAQKRWLEDYGHPLSSFPSYVQESALAAPNVVTMSDDRLVSTAFLYFLCIATQIREMAPKMDFVFELGSGYGGTARVMKLMSPGTKMVLCDLPETLYLCYVYLRRHFPHCTFDVLQPGAKLPERDKAADFTFVPCQLAAQLSGASFDVVMNTCSLSEMTQSACDWYLQLIEKNMTVDYFFHLNRIGTPEELRNCCSTSFSLDRRWEVLKWQWRDPKNFYNASYPNYPWLLNLVLRRIPENIESDLLYASMVKSLRARLAEVEQGSDDWHATLWNLIRLDRKGADIQAYLKVVRTLRWREVEFYESILKDAA